MVIAMMFAAFMVILVRMANQDVNLYQIIFFRNLFALLFFIPYIFVEKQAVFKSKYLHLHCLRAITGVCGMYLWFYSLTVMNLSLAVSLSFTAPLLTAVFSIIFFGEKYGLYRSIALLAGFVGTIIILEPWGENFSKTGLLVILAATFWAITGLLIRTISAQEDSKKIAFYMVFLLTPISLPPALLNWQVIEMEYLLLLVMLGFVSYSFQIFLSSAIASAKFAVILPFDYLRLVFVSILSYFFFNEVMSLNGWVGSAIIMLSSILICYREIKNGKKGNGRGG